MNQEKKYTIGISCIGSGVGQSVITSCRLSGLPIKTIGFGTNAFAFGAYECDSFDYTPTIYADNFVDVLIDKCLEHKVDLLIPGRDDEALIYAKNHKRFEEAGINILVAGQEIIEICRDKERMSRELNPVANVFVECYDRTELETALETGKASFPLIAKPRGGFASQGIEIILSADDFSKITDDHIIQELAIPMADDPNYDYYMQQIARNNNPQVSEISVQVVLGKDGELLGRMASYNKLNNGVPIEIVAYENDDVWAVIDQLMPVFKEKGFVGPLNIQGRLTRNGLKLFEMNPRFTGITGLRALMGFNEVEACIRSWLSLGKGGPLQLNNNRFGIRQTTDKSISLDLSQQVQEFSKAVNGGKVLKNRKTLAITGATGFLGRALIQELLSDDQFDIVALGRNLDKLESTFPNVQIRKATYDDLESGLFPFGSIDILFHGAFARPHATKRQVAESLAFTTDLFMRLGANHIPAIMNISSQSVYGQESEPLWTEQTPVAPGIPYAQAKYASELVLESVRKMQPHLRTTSLRTAALSGGQAGLQPVDFLSRLVKQALEGKTLEIAGGEQQLEIMDVRDAAKAIAAILRTPAQDWHSHYNLGAGEIYSLSDIAQTVRTVVSEKAGGSPVEIEFKPAATTMRFGMDSSLIQSSYQFTPQYKLPAIIESLALYFKEER